MIERQPVLKAARYGLVSVTIAEPFGFFGFLDIRISGGELGQMV